MENENVEKKGKSFKERFLGVGAIWKAKAGSKKDYVKIGFDKKLKENEGLMKKVLSAPSLVAWVNPYKKEGDNRPDYNLFIDTEANKID